MRPGLFFLICSDKPALHMKSKYYTITFLFLAALIVHPCHQILLLHEECPPFQVMKNVQLMHLQLFLVKPKEITNKNFNNANDSFCNGAHKELSNEGSGDYYSVHIM